MRRIVRTVDFKGIEEKWKRKWAVEKAFETDPNSRKRWFGNAAFPYVNAPLHLGHGLTYTRIDVLTRFKRMQSFNVIFPFAFHATGEPIVGVAERLRKDDPLMKKILIDSGISEEKVNDFKDPKFTARFWSKRIKEDLDNLGMSIDWRRSFTTIDPHFNRFIEWQYRSLKDQGYITQGTHPVVWCPSCESPTGDHDRLEGQGESPIEYVVFKFKLPTGEILPMATLRPETIYGVTNAWVNPEVDYVKAKVDEKETWIISKPCAEKLKDQLHSIQIVGEIKGEELLGKSCINPVLMEKIPIFPANFVDPENATGIVMSVPSHAPYDWIALEDLKKASRTKLHEHGIKKSDVERIKPISLIKTPGFGEHPAIEICEKLKIRNQNDVEKLDKATNEVYKKEFHTGVLNEKCGEYQGKKVSECKGELSRDFKAKNLVTDMWELTGNVVCRCATKCHVKILEDQWFLTFSDEGWKQKARECIRKMKFYPEEARKQFEEIVEWLRDRACARKTGLGTRLPWDEEWIVETLSDSVIYMAFYTIAKYVKEIEPDRLDDDVFEYVFRGKGDDKEIAERNDISRELLQKMREEFKYWYGFDLRGSAKELIPNHFTFCIFHHVAMWDDEEMWPRAFTVNGMLNVEGEKMSKSKGNFIILKDAIEKYGADVTRVALMDLAEGLDDVNWTEKNAFSWSSKLKSFTRMVDENYDKGIVGERKPMDIWLESRFQNHVKRMTGHLEEARIRSALTSFHKMFGDLIWYLKRVEKSNRGTVNYALETITKTLSPYAPFTSEEIWERMKKKGFISLAKWPEFDEKRIDREVLKLENAFKRVHEDLKQIIKISGKNEKAYFYVVSDEELDHLKRASRFLEREFGLKEIEVFKVDDPKKFDPDHKSKRAKFGKPGIYLE